MAQPNRKSRVASLHDEAYVRFVGMLVEKRRKAGLSQVELARTLGWSQSMVAKVENTQRRLDIIELIRFARILNFDPARFEDIERECDISTRSALR